MIPEDRRFLETHEWGLLEGDVLTVGLTDFAVRHLSDLVYVQLPELGERVEQNERFGEVESVKAVSDLNAPVSGEVIEVNTAVADTPELITNDCYNDGWIAKIQLEDISEYENLLNPEDYAAQVEKEEEEADLDDELAAEDE
ncbi:MAG: glycine cleavage system protein GcvH [Planctomycetota bacterium]|jgi:glycine cleavage system H protein